DGDGGIIVPHPKNEIYESLDDETSDEIIDELFENITLFYKNPKNIKYLKELISKNTHKAFNILGGKNFGSYIQFNWNYFELLSIITSYVKIEYNPYIFFYNNYECCSYYMLFYIINLPSTFERNIHTQKLLEIIHNIASKNSPQLSLLTLSLAIHKKTKWKKQMFICSI